MGRKTSMAVFKKRFLNYLLTLIDGERGQENKTTWQYDPILALLMPEITLCDCSSFNISSIESATINTNKDPLSAFSMIFKASLGDEMPAEVERRLVALKLGFPHLPATTTATIIQGFGEELEYEDILRAFASHGLSLRMRKFAESRDFVEINRRAAGWIRAIENPEDKPAELIKMRYQAIKEWLKAAKGKKSEIFKQIPMKRALFFHWWNGFQRLGLLGLADLGPELFRRSKIGPDIEAKIVIDRLQHPKRTDSSYVERLATQGINIKRDAIAKVFSKWKIDKWKSTFKANLGRLESDDIEDGEADIFIQRDGDQPRFVEQKYLAMLKGLEHHPVPLSVPGLPMLWAYLDELGLLPILNQMELATPSGKEYYSWLDLLLFDIGRRFMGISTLSGACESASPELAWFAHLYSPPCNDTILDGLTRISEKQVVLLRKWIVNRLAELGLGSGKRIAFDFHQIDLDVNMSNLREFGKGPSPKKKICYTGFRPHVAWDIENNTLLAAEFRKSSARGTTTVRRFTADYILPVFQDLFETVYVDSEYTGKDVWNFILDSENGMGANLTACLKQNRMVKKARDIFLAENEGLNDFWSYYDDDHCYTSKTFPITWQYSTSNGSQKKLTLNCVVKRNLNNAKLRCFGSSKKELDSSEILRDYSSRWIIENGIKDLIHSYFMDRCPGTRPHAVDVHFLVTTICRVLYRMIERDLGENLCNPDGTQKTLDRMRDMLFRQGSATLRKDGNKMIISFLSSYRVKQTKILKQWIEKINQRHQAGLNILGGLSLGFELKPPRGEEYKNSGTKVDLSSEKKLSARPKYG
jgi:hypothetical protein